MADAPTDTIYLFVRNPGLTMRDEIPVVEVPSQGEAYYWSFDIDGQQRLSAWTLEGISPPEVLLEVNVIGHRWNQDDLELVKEYCRVRGFSPKGLTLTTESGYPLARMHKAIRTPSNRKFDLAFEIEVLNEPYS
jgi:hypothetical protein